MSKVSLQCMTCLVLVGVCSPAFSGEGHNHRIPPLFEHWNSRGKWDPGKGGGFGTDGSTLWYGGDFDGRAALSDERSNYRGTSAVYDNFMVTGGGWQVTSVFANLLFNYSTVGADLEIRSGVSAGNPGVLVAASSGAGASQVVTGRTWGGFSEFTVRVDGLNTFLAPGEYWLVVRTVTFSCGSGHLLGRAGTTVGANAIGSPIGDGNSFFNRPGFNFVPTSQLLGAGTWDFSFGVNGVVVPEPSTWILMAGGIALLCARRRR